ncbi:MAG: GspE/PulE family protein [Dethiobacteria bacterium]
MKKKEQGVDKLIIKLENTPELQKAASRAPVVNIVNSLLQEGVEREASDIHLDPEENRLRVRLRTDGRLSDLPPYSRNIMPQLISRLKILAGMDIAEKRLPQDGNIHAEWGGEEINIRVSTLPTIYGEKIVLRLLSPHKVIRPIDELGFNRQNKWHYLNFLRNTHGMVLITGPTGCGKTTTLYSTLHHINDPEKNIITIEDPVEYRLDGINQVQVNRKANLTFANILRTVLRQDPNVIMVGEIRDEETAEMAIRAALTGHQVFSTLHTNDAPRTLIRLLNMGIESYLLSSSLIGVVSQRLVRLNCENCREEYIPPDDELALYQEVCGGSLPVFYRGKGCEYCNFTGFRGRTAIHEVMPITESIRQLIKESTNMEDIRRKFIMEGMNTLLQDGMQRAGRGITTLNEVIRETYTIL